MKSQSRSITYVPILSKSLTNHEVFYSLTVLVDSRLVDVSILLNLADLVQSLVKPPLPILDPFFISHHSVLGFTL